MVPKHRRSEFEASLASVGAPVNTAEFWPEAVGYGQATATAMHPMAGPVGNDYPALNGYDGAAANPDWAASPEGRFWQDWQNWQDLGPPVLHPDHPSAPVPRVQFPADHPSAPMPAARAPSAPPELPRRRPGGSAQTWSGPPQRPDAGHDKGNRRLYAVPSDAPADHSATAPRPPENLGDKFPRQPAVDLAGPAWREPTGFQGQPGPAFREAFGYQGQEDPALREVSHFQRQPGPGRRDAGGYQRQAGPGWQDATDFRRETGPFGPGPGPVPRRSQNGHSPDGDSLWMMAGHVLTRADDRAAQIAQEAQDYAAAIRQAAEREANAITQQAASRADAMTQEAASRVDAMTQEATGRAIAIREAAEREAAELRARFDSMSSELSRVVAYLTENLATPAMPYTVPPMPVTVPPMPVTAPAMPVTAPPMPVTAPPMPASPAAPPDSRPARPGTGSAPPDTRPARPGPRPTGPARPRTAPAKKSQTQSRQYRAMRIATAATAALFSIAVISGATEIGLHGFPFFVFRQGATGETGGSETDHQFLAKEAAAAHRVVSAKGRHHKKSHQTLEVHHN